MKIKLLDVRSEVEEDMGFGTCELCMYNADHHYNIFELEATTETRCFKWEEEAGEWSWGDYFPIYIENIPAFAAWLETHEFDEKSLDWHQYDGHPMLASIVWEYDNAMDEEEEEEDDDDDEDYEALLGDSFVKRWK